MRWHRPLIPISFVAAVAVSLLAAACGSSSPNSSSVASSGDPPSKAQVQQTTQELVRFADCMRSRGVPFPDPSTNPHDFKQALDPSVSHSPAFPRAYTACQHFLPGGGPPSQSPAHSQAQVAAALAFAHCIRSHGFPRFPDPTSNGDLTHEMLANAGINLHQPAVIQAGDACVSVTHGFITPADIARFVAGQ